MSNPTIGFIGYGNMAQAIAEGLVAAGAIDGTDIVACAAPFDQTGKNTAEGGGPPPRPAGPRRPGPGPAPGPGGRPTPQQASPASRTLP